MLDLEVLNIIELIRLQAARQPKHIAYWCSDGGSPLTYSELLAQAEDVADQLKARGAKPGERCGLLLPEGPDFLIHALGILSAGLCIAPMGRFLAQTEVDFVIKAAGLNWLIESPRDWTRFPFAAPIDSQGDRAYLKINPAYIRFTSGTTGKRKGILLGHSTIAERLKAADAVLKVGGHDRIWFQLPMADHFVVSILLYLTRGATVLTTRLSRPDSWTRFVEKTKPTFLYSSPEFYQQLLSSPVRALDEVRLAISTTSLLPHATQIQFLDRFGKTLSPSLGIIEAGLLTLNPRPDKPGSVGQPMPAYQTTILDENGQPLPSGQLGELYVKGPGLLDAYLSPWRPRSAVLTEYGYGTGDFARIDADGFVFLAGRGKNRLVVKGLSFFSEEVEAVLNNLPGIVESRVFFDSKTQQLAAELVGSQIPADIQARLKAKLDSRQVPVIFQEVHELPRTPNGKLLRSMYFADQDPDLAAKRV